MTELLGQILTSSPNVLSQTLLSATLTVKLPAKKKKELTLTDFQKKILLFISHKYCTLSASS